MSDIGVLVVVFGGVLAGLWISYRLFMRGDTDAEHVNSRLPKGFAPDWSWRRGDTYLGYDGKSRRLAIVDYPHSAIIDPREVKSIESMDEDVAWIVQRWLVFYVPVAPGKLRIWFGVSKVQREAMLQKLRTIH